MENKKQIKMGVVLNVFILIAIVLMFLSFFYLYQKRVVEPSNKEVIVNKFEMLLMFNKDNQINGHNIKPGWEEIREFSIENYIGFYLFFDFFGEVSCDVVVCA